eukprot:scaffold23619_cov23-Tisochrysis_lutea.AAC.1
MPQCLLWCTVKTVVLTQPLVHCVLNAALFCTLRLQGARCGTLVQAFFQQQGSSCGGGCASGPVSPV